MRPVLSIIIPTWNAGLSLPLTLRSLEEARACGLLREVIVVDAGSRDGSTAIAQAWGAQVIHAAPGRGTQLAAGAALARGEWLLFLHADTRLASGWEEMAGRFMRAPSNRERAAYFALRFDDPAPAARRLERVAAWRARRLGLPYGDQGLLIAAPFYHRLGGFFSLPLMEDVDLVRRIGRRRLEPLPAIALTDAVRYRREGYGRRMVRNLACLTLYFLRIPPRLILRLYG